MRKLDWKKETKQVGAEEWDEYQRNVSPWKPEEEGISQRRQRCIVPITTGEAGQVIVIDRVIGPNSPPHASTFFNYVTLQFHSLKEEKYIFPFEFIWPSDFLWKNKEGRIDGIQFLSISTCLLALLLSS